MTAFDPLRTIEMLALLEEATTPLRHDVRNRIASIRNLSYFVRRKLAAEVVPERDPRVPEFLAKIEGEVQRTDDLIDVWAVSVLGSRSSSVCRVEVEDCLRMAVACARLSPSVSVELAAFSEPLLVEVDLEVLAFALRCLVENAGEAVGSGSVSLTAERAETQCVIRVGDLGPGFSNPARSLERFESTKPGHVGLGLCMARRIAARFGGELAIGNPEIGAQVSLLLPLAGTGQE